jgi:bacterioferritin-associated ferredoxin
MWICHCKAVTDKDIEAAIEDGARSTVDVALECRAGTGCGGCIPEVRRILRDRRVHLRKSLAADRRLVAAWAGALGRLPD